MNFCMNFCFKKLAKQMSKQKTTFTRFLSYFLFGKTWNDLVAFITFTFTQICKRTKWSFDAIRLRCSVCLVRASPRRNDHWAKNVKNRNPFCPALQAYCIKIQFRCSTSITLVHLAKKCPMMILSNMSSVGGFYQPYHTYHHTTQVSDNNKKSAFDQIKVFHVLFEVQKLCKIWARSVNLWKFDKAFLRTQKKFFGSTSTYINS